MEHGCCKLKDADDGHPARCVGLWSDDKHYYLRRYAEIFTSGMKNKWKNRVYIDMFSGPGQVRIRPNGVFGDGSPLIAAKLDFTHLFLVDLSSICCAALNARMTPFRSNVKAIEVWQEDANKSSQRLLQSFTALGSSTLGFAFLDPPGIELHFDAIRTLATNNRIDLLINFPLGMNIKRQLGHQLARMPNESEFDAYFGTESWRQVANTSGGIPQKIGPQLLKLYKDQLRSVGYEYVGGEKQINAGAVNLYTLIFASKNERGGDFWEKISSVQPSGQTRLI